MQRETEKISHLMICCCADYQRVQPEAVRQLYAAAVHAGIAVELCPDLCLQAVEHPEFLQRLSQPQTAVAACFPRAVTALFHRAGSRPPYLIDLRNQSIEQILQDLDWEQAEPGDLPLPEYNNPWKAWYPAIDAQRCNRCGKCVDYCFFGVYERQDKDIHVASPQNCKNNCPACARMCPQQAIIFPKHPDSPINGGLTDPLASTPVKTDKMFDENLYDRLAQRRREQRKKGLFKE